METTLADESSSKSRDFSLGLDQLLYIATLLPKGFSIQALGKSKKQLKDLPQRNKDLKELSERSQKSSLHKNHKDLDGSIFRQRSKKMSSIHKEEEVAPRTAFIFQEALSPQLKPCWKLLQQLKKHPNAWPFLEPVDPVKLGVPTYLAVIKEPIDLGTIGNNLRSGIYQTPTQFHADISKVFMNSYRFNAKGSEVHMLTKEVESYYQKLVEEPDTAVPEVSVVEYPKKQQVKVRPEVQLVKPLKKKKAAQSSLMPMTLAQKKQLGHNIRRLPRDCLKGVWQIVNDGNIAPEELKFDIDKLPINKARELQKYVTSKLLKSFGPEFLPKESLQTSQTMRGLQEASEDASSFMVSQDSNE